MKTRTDKKSGNGAKAENEFGHYKKMSNGGLRFITTAKHCGRTLVRIFPHQGHIPVYYCTGCKKNIKEVVQ